MINGFKNMNIPEENDTLNFKKHFTENFVIISDNLKAQSDTIQNIDDNITQINANSKKISQKISRTFTSSDATFTLLDVEIPANTEVSYDIFAVGGTVNNVSISLNKTNNETSRDVITTKPISSKILGTITTKDSRKYLEIWKNGVQEDVTLTVEISWYSANSLFTEKQVGDALVDDVSNIKNNVKAVDETFLIKGDKGFQYIELDTEIPAGTEVEYQLTFTGATSITNQALSLNEFKNETRKTNLVQGYSSNAPRTGKITMPHNAKYIELWRNDTVEGLVYQLNLKYKVDGLYANHSEMVEMQKANDDINFELDNIKNRLLKCEEKNPFKYRKFDKSYIVLTIDDANQFLKPIVELCAELNVPLSPAIVPARLNATYEGKTVQAICEEIVANGGEILCHNDKTITNSSTVSDYISVFKDSKIVLESAGFDVRGIVLAGGNGYVVNSQTDLFARMYYDYSDLYGLTAPYNSNRFWYHDYPMSTIKNKIDEFVVNKEFKIFAMHGSSNTSDLEYVDNLREIINYIISKGSENIEIVTWSYVYNTFKSSELEERLKALEK